MLSAGPARRPALQFWPWRAASIAALLHFVFILCVLAWLGAVGLPQAPEPLAVTLIVTPAPARPVPKALAKPSSAAAASSLPLPPPPAPAIARAVATSEPRPRPTPTSAAPVLSTPLAFASPVSPTAPAGPTQPARPATAGNLPPAYPSLSRVLGEQGRVLLGIHVTVRGTPAAVVITQSSGFARLDAAARAAAQTWSFQPALRKGQPVASVLPLWISFRLQ